MNKVKRIGVLTSGGDAPGMNAAVRAVARTALANGIECIGIRRGWQGLINSDFINLSKESVGHILARGGTILYTARSEDFLSERGRMRAVGNRRRRHLPRRAGAEPAGHPRRRHPRHHRQRHRVHQLYHRL